MLRTVFVLKTLKYSVHIQRNNVNVTACVQLGVREYIHARVLKPGASSPQTKHRSVDACLIHASHMIQRKTKFKYCSSCILDNIDIVMNYISYKALP